MSLLDSLFLDSATIDVWVTTRADGLRGSGVAADPWNGGIHYGNASKVTLARGSAWPGDFEATATTSTPHGLVNGDFVEIAGAENNTTVWNGFFGVYGSTRHAGWRNEAMGMIHRVLGNPRTPADVAAVARRYAEEHQKQSVISSPII